MDKKKFSRNQKILMVSGFIYVLILAGGILKSIAGGTEEIEIINVLKAAIAVAPIALLVGWLIVRKDEKEKANQ
ncbi:MAG: hypothetical protein HKP09_07580 [Enterobacterales bacterium]|nr:hypothetical protein [Enterobacterales bacterium]